LSVPRVEPLESTTEIIKVPGRTYVGSDKGEEAREGKGNL
jgi:hypothetical protein